MLTWLLVNVALGCLALLFIRLNSSAPHRLRFFAGFAALVAWLVPWPLLPDLLPANGFSMGLWRIDQVVAAESTRVTGIDPVIVVTGTATLPRGVFIVSAVELMFAAMSVVGALLFIWKVVAHHALLRRLAHDAGDGNGLWARADLAPAYPVAVQREIAGAFTSGLLRPRIWVHADLVQSPHLATLLRHELTHIRQHDNWYLLGITLVERLMWWNPLAWKLGKLTRELLELSCDERCLQADADYPAQLAQLMLDCARGSRQPHVLGLSANVLDDPNPNVKRIALLQRTYPMMKRHIAAAVLTVTSAVAAVGFVTAQPDNVRAVAGDHAQLIRVERLGGAKDDVMIVHGGIAGVPQGAGIVMHQLPAGVPDQFVRINQFNDEASISLKFDDALLPSVLMPLVGFINGGIPPMPARPDVATAGGTSVAGAAIGGLPPERIMRVVSLQGEEGAVDQQDVAAFVAAAPAGATDVFTRGFAMGPATDKLVLEYPEAADRIVSVSGENLSLKEALELIAAESGCNIFQDRDTIVVDYCN